MHSTTSRQCTGVYEVPEEDTWFCEDCIAIVALPEKLGVSTELNESRQSTLSEELSGSQQGTPPEELCGSLQNIPQEELDVGRVSMGIQKWAEHRGIVCQLKLSELIISRP